MNWLMPPETARQERIWMAFPSLGASVFENAASVHDARCAWASVAHAILDFEPVSMIVDPSDHDAARKYLSREIEVHESPLDDAWMRDIGPTFVRSADGELGAVDWVFNGWGARDWARWDNDARVGEIVGRLAGAQVVSSPLINEGGGIQVDGQGTVLVTETVQLDPARNPGLDKAAVEAELARTIGARHVIWLPRGLTRDAERFGTNGHVDMVVAIPSPGRLLVHTQNNAAHPDYEITQQIIEVLAQSQDAQGKPWEITQIPAPELLRDTEGWVDYSYINHLVVNDGVIACRFGDRADDTAKAILAQEYPGRHVVTVDAQEIFARGGGIHCITQQQPALPE